MESEPPITPAEVAALYRGTIHSGSRRAIAQRYGVSKTTAGRDILLARKEGDLPQPNQARRSVNPRTET